MLRSGSAGTHQLLLQLALQNRWEGRKTSFLQSWYQSQRCSVSSRGLGRSATAFLPFRAFCVEGPQNLMFVRPSVCPSVRVSVRVSVCPSRFSIRIGPITDLSQFDVITSI